MKKVLICSLALAMSSAYAEKGGGGLYEVTIVNLTKGQPLTPPVIAVHAPKHKILEAGHPASYGISALARDGVTDLFQNELMADMQVVRSVVGNGVILPGQKQKLTVEANNPTFKFSFFSMLARTNDAISVAQSLPINIAKGQKAVYFAHTYDAGVEDNTELCSDIPAPPCNSPMQGQSTGEGFVRPHEGVLGIGDLTKERDTFANVTAKIVIKRLN